MKRVRVLGAGFAHNQRNAQGGNLSPDVKFPLTARPGDGTIEWIPNPRNVLFTDPKLGVGVRVHAPLSVTTGSPFALTVDIGESMTVKAAKLEAQPKISDVRGLEEELSEGRDLLDATATALLSEISDRAAADAAILARTLDQIPAPVASVDFDGQQALSFRIENRTSDPASPTVGQIWLRTDL